jgi:hypothetical protein
MYVQRTTVVRSCKQCCSEKAVLHIRNVFVAFAIQHEKQVRHIVIYGLSGCVVIFHINSKTTRFSEKVIEHKMCVLIFSTHFIRNISHSKKK